MAKRDYYEVLGVRSGADGRHQEGLPPGRDEVPPGPQSRRSRCRNKFKEATEAYEVLSGQ
jgi:DnaJ-class molecular chaperone